MIGHISHNFSAFSLNSDGLDFCFSLVLIINYWKIVVVEEYHVVIWMNEMFLFTVLKELSFAWF